MMTGQKAINLQKLINAGINVPAFSMIEHDALSGGKELDLSKLPVLRDASGCKFAVRSSASAEDSDSASFAGQFRTFLKNTSENISLFDFFFSVLSRFRHFVDRFVHGGNVFFNSVRRFVGCLSYTGNGFFNLI